jgi:hypothetical protein
MEESSRPLLVRSLEELVESRVEALEAFDAAELADDPVKAKMARFAVQTLQVRINQMARRK